MVEIGENLRDSSCCLFICISVILIIFCFKSCVTTLEKQHGKGYITSKVF